MVDNYHHHYYQGYPLHQVSSLLFFLAPLIILIFLYTKMSLAISQQQCLSTKLKDCCQPKKRLSTLLGNVCTCYCFPNM